MPFRTELPQCTEARQVFFNSDQLFFPPSQKRSQLVVLALKNGLVAVDTENHSPGCFLERGESLTSTNEPGKNVPIEMLQMQCVKVFLFCLTSNKFKPYFHISKPVCILETDHNLTLHRYSDMDKPSTFRSLWVGEGCHISQL